MEGRVVAAVAVAAILAGFLAWVWWAGHAGGGVGREWYLWVYRAGNGSVVVERLGGCARLLRAEPAPGWRLKCWLVNGSPLPASPELRLEVRGNTTVVAVFEPLPRYRLTVVVRGRGAVVGPVNATLLEGERATLVFRPARGWILARVEVDGVERGSAPRLELVMDGDHSVTAVFAKLAEVRLVSNVRGAVAYVNGKLVRLPYTYRGPAPVAVSAPWRLNQTFTIPGGNGTYTWWLGWYTVKAGSEERSYSYYLNRTVTVAGNATVEIHYVPGLADLPYVLRVYLWPPICWIKYMGRTPPKLKIESGTLVTYDHDPNYYPETDLVLEFAPEVEEVCIEFWSEGSGTAHHGKCLFSRISPLMSLVGQGMFDAIFFHAEPGVKYRVLVFYGDVWDLPNPADTERIRTGVSNCALPNTGNPGVVIRIGYVVKPFSEDFKIFVRVVGVG